MGKPYSDDLRERVVAAIEAGHTRVEVAELYNMALSTVGGFIKRKRETGSVRPDKFGGYKTFALEDHTARVKELVAEQLARRNQHAARCGNVSRMANWRRPASGTVAPRRAGQLVEVASPGGGRKASRSAKPQLGIAP